MPTTYLQERRSPIPIQGPDLIQRVKTSYDLATTAQRFGFELSARRNLMVARCLLPSHEDTNPSFTVYPDQRFHCFGCGATGDVIDLFAVMTGRTIPETLKEMASSVETGAVGRKTVTRAPAPLKTFRPDTKALTRAARLYAWILRNHPSAETARAYLEGRGIDVQARALGGLRLGFCPDDDLFETRLKAARMSIRQAARAGLTIASHDEHRKERFAGRITVIEPDPTGLTAQYMAGRTTIHNPPDDFLKFDALPGTKIPLGINSLRNLSTDTVVYITEGIFDWLALAQWDIPVVATLGTNVADNTTRLLASKLRARAVAMAFDADDDGAEKEALLAERIADLSDARIGRLILPPDCRDVADIARLHQERGPQLVTAGTAFE